MYSAFVKYKENKQLTIVEGPGIMMGDTELDALLASSLETPVVLTLNGHQHMSVNETFNHVVSVCVCVSGGKGEGDTRKCGRAGWGGWTCCEWGLPPWMIQLKGVIPPLPPLPLPPPDDEAPGLPGPQGGRAGTGAQPRAARRPHAPHTPGKRTAGGKAPEGRRQEMGDKRGMTTRPSHAAPPPLRLPPSGGPPLLPLPDSD